MLDTMYKFTHGITNSYWKFTACTFILQLGKCVSEFSREKESIGYIHMYIEGKNYFQELTHMIEGASKSKIHRAEKSWKYS